MISLPRGGSATAAHRSTRDIVLRLETGFLRSIRYLQTSGTRRLQRAVTSVIFLSLSFAFLIRSRFRIGKIAMDNLIFCLIVQLNLMFGVAGLLWPDKLMPLFGVLMFPWPATHRAIRLNGIVAIVGYVLALAKLVAVGH